MRPIENAYGLAATGTRQGYGQHIGKGKTLQRKGNAKQVLQKRLVYACFTFLTLGKGV